MIYDHLIVHPTNKNSAFFINLHSVRQNIFQSYIIFVTLFNIVIGLILLFFYINCFPYDRISKIWQFSCTVFLHYLTGGFDWLRLCYSSSFFSWCVFLQMRQHHMATCWVSFYMSWSSLYTFFSLFCPQNKRKLCNPSKPVRVCIIAQAMHDL